MSQLLPQFKKISDWVNEYRRLDSTHFCYINLFPNEEVPRKTESFSRLGTTSSGSFESRPLSCPSTIIRVQKHYDRDLVWKSWNHCRCLFHENSISLSGICTHHGSRLLSAPDMAELRFRGLQQPGLWHQGILVFTHWHPSGRRLWFSWWAHHPRRRRTPAYEPIKAMNGTRGGLMYFQRHGTMVRTIMAQPFPGEQNDWPPLPAPFTKLARWNRCNFGAANGW